MRALMTDVREIIQTLQFRLVGLCIAYRPSSDHLLMLKQEIFENFINNTLFDKKGLQKYVRFYT